MEREYGMVILLYSRSILRTAMVENIGFEPMTP